MDKRSGIIFDGEKKAGSIYFTSFPDVPDPKEVLREAETLLLPPVTGGQSQTLPKAKTEQTRETPVVLSQEKSPGESKSKLLKPRVVKKPGYPRDAKIKVNLRKDHFVNRIAVTLPEKKKRSIPYRAYHVEEETVKRRLSFRGLMLGVSSGLIAISVFGFLFLFWPILVQEARYRLILSHQTTATDQKFPGFPQGDQWAPPNTTFSIVVPKIDAKAPIIANVDSGKESEYVTALKQGVAQAKGTCLPGMDCTMYLFAHSAGSPVLAARYNAVFYLLGKLETGDQIIVYYNGKKILYEVTGKAIVSPVDTEYITNSGKEEQLILQTCDPPGTTLNRLLVFAKPKLVEYIK